MRRKEEAAHVKPPTAAYFPLFMDLSDRRVVFVGGGTIALRRIRTLLQFVGDIVVYAPDFSPELERFAADGIIELVRKRYDASVLDGADIVMACTNDGDLNGRIWEECKRRGILVNVCSDRFKCDFYFPGVAMQDNVVVGVTAGGKNHRQVKQLRARIQRLMEEEDI
jgi:precorrin-2 dehydrogenase/sirohydrochlorin ferrochelatase